MRGVASRNWKQELDSLPAADRINFWTGLAYTMPNAWVCARCCKLHLIYMKASDIAPDTPQSRSWLSSSTCYADRPALSQYGYFGYSEAYYEVRHRHVQLALKHSRLGIKGRHLQMLLAQWQSKPSQFNKNLHWAQPKIVDDRFLLRERHTVAGDQEPLSRRSIGWTTIGLTALWFCPHLVLTPIWGEDELPSADFDWQAFHPSIEFENSVAQAFANAGTEFDGCCNHCFTDYSVLVSRSRRAVTFQIWRDFGTHDSPENWTWRSQVKVEGINDAYNAYKTWDRVSGSVREQFEKSQN
ncbi:hypothetical protein QQX98_001693 [Neonectria punicea]|uniref:Uncharacterized protein n=1 Tax=Neonectria punicea TaxID=979145 RepID=A0ABR1HN61_9HYPO